MLQIQQALITNRSNRPFQKLQKLKGIIIHWTANPKRGAGASAHSRYFQNQSVQASAHYMVDDKNIIQIIPDDEVAYHVGSRSYRTVGNQIMEGNYSPNHFLLGIEMCVNEDSDWDDTYKNTVELTQYLLQKYNLTVNQIWRHWDITGKDCPKMMCESEDAGWQRFLNIVKTGNFPNESSIIGEGSVNTHIANIRQGNGPYFSVIKTLPKDTKVKIYEEVGTWYRIDKGQWISKSLISSISSQTALQKAKVNIDKLNIRSGPSTIHPVVGQLFKDDKVNIYKTQGDWANINLNQWVHGAYLENETNVSIKKFKVNASQLNVRKGPGTQFPVVAKLNQNDIVNYISESNGWVNIGQDQWVSSQFLVLVVDKKGVVITNTLNIRKGPGTQFGIVGRLHRNDSVTINSEEGEWLSIGNDQWVNSNFITVSPL